MELRELFENGLSEVFGGSHGFGGFGQRFFARRHYWALVDALDSDMPSVAKTAVVDWLCDVLRRDNPGFKPDQFRRAVAERRWSGTGKKAEFQQRHFYYLAELITRIESQPMREYIAMWLADFFGRANGFFQRKRWFDYCGVPDPDAQEEPEKNTGRKRRA